MSKISASVVLYNTQGSQLRKLLGCIERSSISVETYLIDNSPDRCDLAYKGLPSVSYIKAEANNGYGAGHNIALQRVLQTSEFHFVLNPDISFEAEELEKMIAFMKENPVIGQLMPKIIYPDGSLQYLCKLIPSPADLILRRFSFGPLRKIAMEKMERFELRHSSYGRTMDVPSLSGCFMLFRTSALSRVGLFDQRFFMYLEDFDLTRRMHVQFRTVYFPGATVMHDHAAASYQSGRALWTHILSAIRYFNKWGWFRDPERSRINRETLESVEQIQRKSI